jgi:hypothetical protein
LVLQKQVIEIADRRNDEKQVRHPIFLKRILAPTDLTLDGKKAVDYAVALAEHFDAQLTLLHVYQALGAYDYARMLNDASICRPLSGERSECFEFVLVGDQERISENGYATSLWSAGGGDSVRRQRSGGSSYRYLHPQLSLVYSSHGWK